MKIKIHPMEIRRIDYRKLKPLQGNLKDLTDENYKRLKKSFKEKGMIVPVFVWERKVGKGVEFMLLDGHGRERLFRNENAVFVDPEGNDTREIPCLLVRGKDLKDAKENILVISSQFQRITQDGLNEFAADLDESWIFETTAFDALKMPRPPDMIDTDVDGQSSLDETDPTEPAEEVKCPKCGHEFTPGEPAPDGEPADADAEDLE